MLTQAEHVGVFHYASFCKQIYDLLDDDGTFFLQVSGFRQTWQFEDLNWYASTLFPADKTNTCWQGPLYVRPLSSLQTKLKLS